MRDRARIDLPVDPAPDLALQVDVTHSSLDRLAIYAALGVLEVWRLHEQGLAFHVLGPQGDYVVQSHSPLFSV